MFQSLKINHVDNKNDNNEKDDDNDDCSFGCSLFIFFVQAQSLYE